MKHKLFWVDLEMTGLNPRYDTILEIASIVTDDQLNIIAEGPNLVIHQDEATLLRMNDWCKEHHASTGLTEAVKNSSITMLEAEKKTLAFMKEHCVEKEAMLCGNSIWTDRSFLTEYMPQVTNFVHYRVIDVSSIKQLIYLWYPHNPHIEFPKKKNHRALDDIRESIEELKHYRQYFFVR